MMSNNRYSKQQILERIQKIKYVQKLNEQYKIAITNRNIAIRESQKNKKAEAEPAEIEVKNFAYEMQAYAATPSNFIAIPSIGFNGSHLLSLYNVPTVKPKSSVRKVKVAIVVAYTYPKVKADLYTYWTSPANFGPDSTPPNITVYTMPGASQNQSWSMEECIDVQAVCTINPNADIYVVEAVNGSLSSMIAALDYASINIGADVISMSWGGNESNDFLKYSSRFNNTNICYCAATGDSNFVSWPATLENCVAVGGTTLLWTPGNNSNRTEFTWPLAGCGYSNMIAKPAYQNSVNNSNNRCIPDVSLVANQQNGVYIINNGKWMCMGGTSLATPIFAGMLSIANQKRLNAGKSTLTTVYSSTSKSNPQNNIQSCLYNSSLYDMFNDIVLGTNAGSYGNSLQTFNTGTNYDIPTGLGSPNCEAMCNYLFKL